VKIDQHISELLYDHDCVIVPSFGGFLASYQPAHIHPVQHLFSPPSKKIAFNVFLKQNDGLLANHLVGSERILYSEALDEVKQHVHQWQNELSEGKKLVIERIGTFYLDKENNLQFEPDKNVNYLKDAFGLNQFRSLPVNRDDERSVSVKKAKEILRPSKTLEKQPVQFNRKTRRKVFRTLIISGALLWLSFNIYLVTPHRFSLGTLNPFSGKSHVETIKKAPAPAKVSVAAPAKTEATTSTAVAPVNPPVSVETNKAPVHAEADAVQSASPAENQKYFVIGGAFMIPENAEGFVKQLQSEGFADARVLEESTHLKKVCFNGFSTYEEALKELDSLKAKNRSAWVYRK